MRLGARLLVCAACVVWALAGCGNRPVALQSAWPVASAEATVAPPADALRYPLTGLPASSQAAVTARPLCVKITDSATASGVAGVGWADIVYETGDGQNRTQLACLFQSRVPGRLAPVGPAGMPDLWVTPQFAGALFSTGAPATLSASIARSGLINLSQDTTASFAYGTGRAHGVTLTGATAAQTLRAAGLSVNSSPQRMRFSEQVQTGSAPISAISVPFSAGDVANWAYDSKHGTYRRSVNKLAQTDSATRKPVAVNNVVVMWAHYTPLDPDVAGGGGYDVTLGGSGQVSVFRNGQRFDGRWKADGQSAPRFIAEGGTVIMLAPGSTWIEAIPLSTDITLR